jgi:hypothetical protein
MPKVHPKNNDPMPTVPPQNPEHPVPAPKPSRKTPPEHNPVKPPDPAKPTATNH